MNLEKPIKEFIKQVQKDVSEFQKTVQKEGDVLVRKFKGAVNKKTFIERGKEIEKLVETKMKQFEPALETFLMKITNQAERAGIDISDLERSVMSNFKKARTKLRETAKKVKKKSKSSAGKKSTASKAAPKKATTKKTASKKAAVKKPTTKSKTAKKTVKKTTGK